VTCAVLSGPIKKGKVKIRKSLQASDLFFNPAAWTRQTAAFFINPLGESQGDRFSFPIVVILVLFSLRILRAAMFAEPAVTEIEEMVRLVHVGCALGAVSFF
jgi:hypothetical protein